MEPPKGREYPLAVTATGSLPNSCQPHVISLLEGDLGRTPNTQQVSGSQSSGKAANSRLEPSNLSTNSSALNSALNSTAPNSQLDAATHSPRTQSPPKTADDSDQTISVSEDSEFERVEDEIRRKTNENNKHTITPIVRALRSRYWEAYRDKKMAAKSLMSQPQRSAGMSKPLAPFGDVIPRRAAKVSNQYQVPIADVPRVRSMYELFCGSGRMAAEFAKKGYQAIGIDYKNKDKPECACLKFDLREPTHQELLMNLLLDDAVEVVWFGPPCGTASAARKIRRQDGPDPKELRTQEFPNGKPDLQGADLAKVQSANRLYEFTGKAFLKLSLAGKVCILENPGNSLFWETSWMRDLFHQLEAQQVSASQLRFQMCMHGGKRDKVTKLLYSNICLRDLAVMCDKSHQHEPWGWIKDSNGTQVFATAEERRYPRELCEKVVGLITTQKGVPQALPISAVEHQTQVYAQRQPRKSRPIMPEYKLVYKLAKSADVGTLPDGYKILQEEQGEHGQNLVTIGQSWGVEDFVDTAKACTHPFDLQVKVEVEQAEAW